MSLWLAGLTINMLPDGDALPSWSEGKAKRSVFDFVERICHQQSPHFLPLAERIATFDHDGTLWVEKPLLTQLAFTQQQVMKHPFHTRAEHHQSLFASIADDFENMLADASTDLNELLNYVFDGFTTEQYRDRVATWITQAKHPRFDRLYTQLIYQPMLELMAYLRAHDFTLYLVSGGSADFIRPWSEQYYQVPRQQIIGSSMKTHLLEEHGELGVALEPIPFFFDNGPDKVLGIERAIARRPIAAFGNSHGDVEMLRWAGSSPQSLCMLIHHTDAIREYKYSPDAPLNLGKSVLKIAAENNWMVVDMQHDWLNIFDFKE